MSREAAVVDGNTAYFRSAASIRVYSYQNILGNELAVIDSLFTSVGCWGSRGPTDTLLSLTGKGERKQWSEVFLPMPTPRSLTACITIEKALIVAGGYAGGGDNLATVGGDNLATNNSVYI